MNPRACSCAGRSPPAAAALLFSYYRAADGVLEPYGFRAPNLALHALNGLLVYVLAPAGRGSA